MNKKDSANICTAIHYIVETWGLGFLFLNVCSRAIDGIYNNTIHYNSRRVEDEVPGVVAVLCEYIGGWV